FCHRDEELTRRTVAELSDGDVALMPLDRKLVRQRVARIRKPTPLRPVHLDDPLDRDDRLRDLLGVARVGVHRQRLGLLASVSVDRDRLHAVLPGLEVRVGDVLDGRGLRQVHGLADGAGDEGLARPNHYAWALVAYR